MTAKPLTVSGNRNLIAFTYYALMALLGVVFMLGVAPPLKYIVDLSGGQMVGEVLVGEVLARVWSVLLFVSGSVVLASMLFKEVTYSLKVERVGAFLTGAMMAWVIIGIFVTATPSIFGVIVVGKFAIAGLARSIQTHFELRRINRARECQTVTHGEYLADPDREQK